LRQPGEPGVQNIALDLAQPLGSLTLFLRVSGGPFKEHLRPGLDTSNLSEVDRPPKGNGGGINYKEHKE